MANCVECQVELKHDYELYTGYCKRCNELLCDVCKEVLQRPCDVYVKMEDGQEVARGHRECIELTVRDIVVYIEKLTKKYRELKNKNEFDPDTHYFYLGASSALEDLHIDICMFTDRVKL